MTEERIHRAVASDGTAIVGHVKGQGPPLVFVHGSMADGDSDWDALLPWLANRYTCYLPSTRCRGQSDTHSDLSNEARVDDVTAFVESIGEPVAVMALSAGSTLALGAAARTSAITALAAYEPLVVEAIDERTQLQLHGMIEEMQAAAAEGRSEEAAKRFLSFAANEEEYALLTEDPEVLVALARYLPTDLQEMRATLAHDDGGGPTAASTLARISAPTLLLRGSDTASPWFAAGVRHVADRVSTATVRDVPGAGHLGPLLRPEAVARELASFLQRAHVAA